MRATTMTPDHDRDLWVVRFDGDMILDRRFFRHLNQWLHENGSGKRFISRRQSEVCFLDETDALLCLMAYR
jgi:cellulose synthase/poly-beta-1,6-N-acetylglucosamine synthase-like glycosyltransferase